MVTLERPGLTPAGPLAWGEGWLREEGLQEGAGREAVLESGGATGPQEVVSL